jgi:hypothetical protein
MILFSRPATRTAEAFLPGDVFPDALTLSDPGEGREGVHKAVEDANSLATRRKKHSGSQALRRGGLDSRHVDGFQNLIFGRGPNDISKESSGPASA